MTKHNLTLAEVTASNAESQRLFEEEFSETKPSVLIFSSEHLVQLSEDRRGLNTLREYLLGFAKRVEVVFYVRDPLLLMISRLFHGVKRGDRRLNAPFANMPELAAPGVIEAYRSAFGPENLNLPMFPGDLPDKPDVMDSFWSVAGLSALERDVDTVSLNKSLSGAGLLIGDALMDIQEGKPGQLKNGFRLQHIGGPKLRLDADTVVLMRERCEETYIYFRETWGIEFPDCDLVGPPRDEQNLFTDEAVHGIAQTISDLAEELTSVRQKAEHLRRKLKQERNKQ
ncbi:hypothetical protein [Shimia sagamensis]|uniref:hypothetical protein n=1 Tax=Shimia sagamensis TaxID=1566352 RepID=UPI0024B6C3D1|nr:hypothetical protein [Shimia sagamensis]